MSDSKPEDDAVATEPRPSDASETESEPGSETPIEGPSETAAPAEDSAAKAPGADVQEPARPKKRKRSKAAAEAAAAKQAENADEALASRPLDAQGRERPLFLSEFPEDPRLSRLVVAFEAGNYALIRSDAEKLAEQTSDPLVRDAALELRRRIDPDPLIKYLLGLAVALLLFLVFYTYQLH